MLKLSRTVFYAVQATLQLAQAETEMPVPCSHLAADGNMPERFLLQILRHLVTHGILHSTRGVEGGYALERRPEEISLLEVIEAIEGPLTGAALEVAGSPHESRLHAVLERIGLSAREQLASVKISDLMEPAKAPGTNGAHG